MLEAHRNNDRRDAGDASVRPWSGLLPGSALPFGSDYQSGPSFRNIEVVAPPLSAEAFLSLRYQTRKC